MSQQTSEARLSIVSIFVVTNHPHHLPPSTGSGTSAGNPTQRIRVRSFRNEIARERHASRPPKNSDLYWLYIAVGNG